MLWILQSSSKKFQEQEIFLFLETKFLNVAF